jgi:hypothetical protein
MIAACGGAAPEAAVTNAPPAAATAPDTTTAPTTTTEAPGTSEFLSTSTTTLPFQPTVFCFEEPPPPYGRSEDPYTFDPDFYAHYCSASGIYVVGSDNTPIEALEAAARIVDRLFSHDPRLVTATIQSHHAVILTGPDEVAGDLPEWEYEQGRTFTPDPDHPGFASSGGGLSYVVAPADDVTCSAPTEVRGSYGTPDWGIVLIHELGHLVEEALGLTGLEALYEVGRASGAWDSRHYAMTNPREYWAEVVQVYLGQYERRRRGHSQPTTRAELRERDPAAFDLAASIFEGSTLVSYWCDVYAGPILPLPEAASSQPPG